jgi:hypothetical protein
MQTITQRDADGKIAPKFGRTWVKKTMTKKQQESERRERLMNDPYIQQRCAEMNIPIEDAWMWF